MVPDVPGARVVADRDQVDAAFARLVAAVQAVVAQEPCVLLGVLLGGLLPLARLAGRLEGDFVLDTCRVGRYGDATRGGELRLMAEPVAELRGRHVVLVDDICDEGVTLDFLVRHCRQAGASQVSTAVLVRKRHERGLPGFEPDFVGLDVGDEFVFGCGMDFRGHWRHLREIWAVKG